MMGVIVSLDSSLLFLGLDVFFAAEYFLIGIWGVRGRGYAAIKFFLISDRVRGNHSCLRFGLYYTGDSDL